MAVPAEKLPQVQGPVSISREGSSSPRLDQTPTLYRPVLAEMGVPNADILNKPSQERDAAIVNLFKARKRALHFSNTDPNKDDYVDQIDGKLDGLVPGFEMKFPLTTEELAAGQAMRDWVVINSTYDARVIDAIPSNRRLRANTLGARISGSENHDKLVQVARSIVDNDTFKLKGIVIREPQPLGGDWYIDRVIIRANYEARAEELAQAEIVAERAAARRAEAERQDPIGQQVEESQQPARPQLRLVYDASASAA